MYCIFEHMYPAGAEHSLPRSQGKDIVYDRSQPANVPAMNRLIVWGCLGILADSIGSVPVRSCELEVLWPT